MPKTLFKTVPIPTIFIVRYSLEILQVNLYEIQKDGSYSFWESLEKKETHKDYYKIFADKCNCFFNLSDAKLFAEEKKADQTKTLMKNFDEKIKELQEKHNEELKKLQNFEIKIINFTK